MSGCLTPAYPSTETQFFLGIDWQNIARELIQDNGKTQSNSHFMSFDYIYQTYFLFTFENLFDHTN